MLTIFTIPDPDTFASNGTEWVAGLTTDLLLIAAVITSITLIGLFIGAIKKGVTKGTGKLTGAYPGRITGTGFDSHGHRFMQRKYKGRKYYSPR